MKKILILLFISSISFSSFSQVDDPACLDVSLKIFTPFEGFYLTDFCKYAEFGTYDFWVDRGSRIIKKEGVYRESWYHKMDNSGRDVSGLQILKNYVNAIIALGGVVLKESDGNIFTTKYQGKELWILLDVNQYGTNVDNYGIISIEVDVMKQEISAQDISGSLVSQGKIALYGIHFETGKSDITADSEQAINSIATFLKENPEINIYIVGHTDNVGSYETNQTLSKRRAESVKNSLVTKYSIAATRLIDAGVGPVSPVISNDTEEGRALNRRVEIVKK